MRFTGTSAVRAKIRTDPSDSTRRAIGLREWNPNPTSCTEGRNPDDRTNGTDPSSSAVPRPLVLQRRMLMRRWTCPLRRRTRETMLLVQALALGPFGVRSTQPVSSHTVCHVVPSANRTLLVSRSIPIRRSVADGRASDRNSTGDAAANTRSSTRPDSDPLDADVHRAIGTSKSPSEVCARAGICGVADGVPSITTG